jgi:hypothetical protein
MIARLVDLTVESVPAIVAVAVIPSSAIGFPVFMLLHSAVQRRTFAGSTTCATPTPPSRSCVRVRSENFAVVQKVGVSVYRPNKGMRAFTISPIDA